MSLCNISGRNNVLDASIVLESTRLFAQPIHKVYFHTSNSKLMPSKPNDLFCHIEMKNEIVKVIDETDDSES